MHTDVTENAFDASFLGAGASRVVEVTSDEIYDKQIKAAKGGFADFITRALFRHQWAVGKGNTH